MTCLVFTVLWLVFLIAGVASAGPLATFDQVLAHVGKLDMLFYGTYVNAALVTIFAVMLFAALYEFCRLLAPTWAGIAIAFVPIYGAMNLLVYLSQVTIVPRLVHLMGVAEHRALSAFVLRQLVQQWPDSAVFVVNNLGYAILGIPSLIFGVLLFQAARSLRSSGVLLALSGVASIVGFVGIALGNAVLRNGSIVGGVVFLLALVPMSWVFLRQSDLAGEAVQQAHRAVRPKVD
jgi:hypothetical protein